jgi:hypothetical protein
MLVMRDGLDQGNPVQCRGIMQRSELDSGISGSRARFPARAPTWR